MEEIKYFSLLQEQKNNKCKNSLYYISQLELAYNSSKLAGVTLSDYDIKMMYDESAIAPNGKVYKLNDIFETYNHFHLFDYILDNINTPLSNDFIKKVYKILKKNTTDEMNFPNTFGEFRKQKLEHVNYEISLPENIENDLSNLISQYEMYENKILNNIVDFHFNFECIHPFADGNGRIGRILIFKECLRNNITPFVILDESKLDYYRGLKAYKEDKTIFTTYCSKLQQIFENVASQFKNSSLI